MGSNRRSLTIGAVSARTATAQVSAATVGSCSQRTVTGRVFTGFQPITVYEAEIREYLEGNLCRCTGYHNIVKAIRAAADQLNGTAVAAE